MTFKNRILLMTISISVVVVISIYFSIKKSVIKTVDSIETDNARKLLDIAMLSIKNQYTSLNFHKEYTFQLKKNERKDIVAIAISTINKYYNEFKKGQLTEQQAQKLALQSISEFRFDDGNGYIWINNTEQPIPRILIHPIYPEFNNKISTDPIFYTSQDSNNIPRLAMDLCEEKGSGFIEYFWSKPTSPDFIGEKPKISYVELFQPWQWILGTGVYLEDIERDVQKRMDAILEELKQTIGQIKIAETGYFFIFNSKKELLLHPALYDGFGDTTIYLSVISPLDDIIKAKESSYDSYEYSWNNPKKDKDKFTYKKKVYIEYFEPLDWYVCASIYQNEIKKPAELLGKKVLIISFVFLIVAIIFSLRFSASLAKPLQSLMNFATRISTTGQSIDVTQIPVFGSKETRALSLAIRDMLISLEEQKNQILAEKSKTEESEVKLRESENKYRTLFFSAGDAAFIFQENKIVECNEKAVKIMKGKKEEILGLTAWEISPPFQPDGKSSREKALTMHKNTLKGEPVEFEWVHMNLLKEHLYIDVTLSLINKEKKLTMSTWRDVTSKKAAEKALLESEEKFRMLIENSPTFFWILDQKLNLKYASFNVTQQFGVNPDEYKDKGKAFWSKIIHPQDLEKVINEFSLIFLENKQFNIEYRIRNRNSQWTWVHSIGEKSISVFGENIAFGISNDITEKKLTEQRVLQAIMQSEEKERSRIAKDLHDGVSPLLSAIKLFTQSISHSKDGIMKTELSEKISSTIGEAIQSINEISANISPHILENFGLIIAVESFLNNILAHRKLNFSVESNIEERLSKVIEIALYRISIELINNTLKYANAAEILIEYSLNERNVQMKYKDDGVGFDIKNVLDNNIGMGLFNIKSRVNSLDGNIRISSKKNEGISVLLMIPIENYYG